MHRHRSTRRPRGQVIPITALAMISLIGGVALILEGGNAYAHQREGAERRRRRRERGRDRSCGAISEAPLRPTLMSPRPMNGRRTRTRSTTTRVLHRRDRPAYLTNGGVTTSNIGAAARVGDGSIPPGAQGVQAVGTQTSTTTFGRVLGFNQFTADGRRDRRWPARWPVAGSSPSSSRSTSSIARRTATSAPARRTGRSATADGPGGNPEGQEYIVPLCKTGDGSFMVLDLDGTMNNCDDEAANPPAKQFAASRRSPVGQRQQLQQSDGGRVQRMDRQGRLDPDLRRGLHDQRRSHTRAITSSVWPPSSSTTSPTRTTASTRRVSATARP